MIVGGYSLHLYCDNPMCAHKSLPDGRTAVGEFAADQTYREAKRTARAAGWKFRADMKTGEELCFCRHCP